MSQLVTEDGSGIVIGYELVRINDNKFHSFFTVSSFENFSRMMNTGYERE